MKRHLKPILVTASVVAALTLTVYRHDNGGGGIGVTAHRPSSAAPGRQGKQQYDLSALKVFNTALVRIKDNYVKPEMIKPREMLVSALDAVEKSIAEVLVEEDKKRHKLHVKVDSYEKEFDISGVDSPWTLSSRLRRILGFIQAHLLESTAVQDVEYAAVNGMLDTLDPHSLLLKPEVYNEMKLSTRGEFGGLGIVISMVEGVLTVMNPMKETPADAAGIKACDQILKIGPESSVNMTLSQAVSRLRGRPGSKVEITVMRDGWSKPVKKVLTRDIIKVPSVKSRMLAKRIGYVQLSNFQGNSVDDLRGAIAKLRRDQMQGLVLDLRGNPGGLLDQAIKIADLFINSGTLVTTVSHAGKRRDEKRANNDGTEPQFPLAVLVDSGSASASEIVAGALKNLDRAVVIGKRTFGKGTVQVLYDNDDGSALKLTIAEYLTPGDVSIQATGIVPDVGTVPMFARKDFVHLSKEDVARREGDLDKHLTRAQKRLLKANKPAVMLSYLADDKEEEEEEKSERKNICLFPDRECKADASDDEFKLDYHIELARDMLARATSWRRSRILASSKSFFKQQEVEQEKRLVEALKKIGVDWRETKSGSGKPDVVASLVGYPKTATAEACRKLKLELSVKNRGSAPTSRLKAVMKSSNDMFDGHELVFGRIEPGQSRSWEVPIAVRDAPTRLDEVTFKFSEANGHAPQDYTVPVKIKGKKRPVFAYGYQIIDDTAANEDGRVQRGEQVRLFVKVNNTGKGAAPRAVTTLQNLSGPGIFIRKGRFILGRLEPGETRTASFTFDVEKAYASDTFKVELLVYDEALHESVSNKLEFPIAPAGPSPEKASGTVRVSADRAELRSWGSTKAEVVGDASRGAAFKVVGQLGHWYKVQLTADRTAFVSSKEVTPGGNASASRFSSRWQVTPPKISVKIPTYATAEPKIRIEGTATDHEQVKDMFIFVRNSDAKITPRKVFYLSNSSSNHPKKLDFATDVPLWPGANYVSIHVRENADVQAKETVVIFHKKNLTVADSKKQAAAHLGR